LSEYASSPFGFLIFLDKVLYFLSETSLKPQSSCLHPHAGITDANHQAWFICWDEDSLTGLKPQSSWFYLQSNWK
jgi:hypothetical protein